jgi:hypothetical protein
MRERIGGERGAIGAGTVVLLGVLGLIVYLLLAVFEGDTAQFGAVSVPSKGQVVELPKGDIDVYYAEKVDPDAGVPLVVPDDLKYVVVGSDGQNVAIRSRGDEAKSTGDGMTRLIGSLRTPAEGRYAVTSTSSQAGQRVSPKLTFGQGPFAAIGQRFKDVVDALRGPLGIVVLAVLVFLFMLPRWRVARRRQAYKDQR